MGKYIQPNIRQQHDAYLKPLRKGVATLNKKIVIAKDSDKLGLAQERNRLLDQIYFERKGWRPSLDNTFDKNPWLYNIPLYTGDHSDLLLLDVSTEQTDVYVG